MNRLSLALALTLLGGWHHSLAASAPAASAPAGPTAAPAAKPAAKSAGKAATKPAAKAVPAPAPVPTPGDAAVARYFAAETAKVAAACLAQPVTKEGWEQQRAAWRLQLREMLGLVPWPERGELRATITGRLEHAEFTVEKLHFQSLPQLYVTANLYLPKNRTKPAPAILYVCGHGQVKVDGVSMGNKTSYQHHGEWFARHGYVCLTIDTIQLGEIEGMHHGTRNFNQWWWNARGYTPAGVEAWNGLRALDYLQSRPEVDPERLGVTGRSGGGAYSWWITALDDRIKAAAPIAGITDMHNHVVDGLLKSHCDCMFMVNTYRWDFAQVAALAAPRPLLLGNGDKDLIFPLDGVYRVQEKVRRVYRALGAEDKFGLLITEGPHKDTQDLQLPVFRWFDRWLKGEDTVVEKAATKHFAPQELKVLARLPADQIVTKIAETFVPVAPVPAVPNTAAEWTKLRDSWQSALREKCFRGWPDFGAGTMPDLAPEMVQKGAAKGTVLYVAEFNSQDGVRLRLYGIGPQGAQLQRLRMFVLDEAGFAAWATLAAQVYGAPMAEEAALLAKVQATVDPAAVQAWHDLIAAALAQRDTGLCFFAPRGLGFDRWNPPADQRQNIRRRFMLLGQTVDGMRVWDIRRAIEAMRMFDEVRPLPIEIEAAGAAAVNVLYATLGLEGIEQLRLRDLPASHREGPDYLNVLRYLDIPQAVAMAAERTRVRLVGGEAATWRFPLEVGRQLRWAEDRLLCE